MKGYELIKAITERKIKNNTKIKVKMGSTYKATLKYENFMLKWESGDFDTSILCSAEADFKVIEEKKELEEKLDWEEIIGSVKKPLWDNKKKIWRVLDSYYREGDIFKISFSDTSNFERFENQELYFKEREEK